MSVVQTLYRLTKKRLFSNDTDSSANTTGDEPTAKRKRQFSRLLHSPEVLSEILLFLDRFTLDAAEISCRLFFESVSRDSERLAWRHVHQADIAFINGACELWLRALLPTNGYSIAYRERRSTLRTIVKRYNADEAPEFFAFTMSAMYYCHVEYLYLGCYYMTECIAAIIAQYASAISVKHLYCWRLLRSAGPFEQDLAVFYGAFEKFASIEFVTCSSCAPGIENALRDLCTAKQILFAVL